ncbi:MAG: GNAT family N-acetyltransferase [Christensenellaceae bacterium]
MISQIRENKKQYLELLLLADEQETMIDRYLDCGEMFALFEGDLKAICVVTDEGDGICELKNIATVVAYQGKGYGKKLVDFICDHYCSKYATMLVGTGDSLHTIPFYQRCGFVKSHKIKNFFIDHYDHPIFEDGKQLVDMIYLSKKLCTK